MSKATHNGTCQACGRVQAYNGVMAKHGYTVETGYFSGTCSGSDRLPLELATEHNEQIVQYIRNWADEQDMFANGNIETVDVRVRVRNDYGQFETKIVAMNREEYVTRQVTRFDNPRAAKAYSKEFDNSIENKRENMRRSATSARKDADLLEQLREKTFGKELEARYVEDAPQPQRETFTRDANQRGTALHDAYDRQRELKAEGIKSRVTGSASYATITYRK